MKCRRHDSPDASKHQILPRAAKRCAASLESNPADRKAFVPARVVNGLLRGKYILPGIGGNHIVPGVGHSPHKPEVVLETFPRTDGAGGDNKVISSDGIAEDGAAAGGDRGSGDLDIRAASIKKKKSEVGVGGIPLNPTGGRFAPGRNAVASVIDSKCLPVANKPFDCLSSADVHKLMKNKVEDWLAAPYLMIDGGISKELESEDVNSNDAGASWTSGCGTMNSSDDLGIADIDFTMVFNSDDEEDLDRGMATGNSDAGLEIREEQLTHGKGNAFECEINKTKLEKSVTTHEFTDREEAMVIGAAPASVEGRRREKTGDSAETMERTRAGSRSCWNNYIGTYHRMSGNKKIPEEEFLFSNEVNVLVF